MANETIPEINTYTDSYTIGTASTGGAIKIYFTPNLLNDPDAITKIDKAFDLVMKSKTAWNMKVTKKKGGIK